MTDELTVTEKELEIIDFINEQLMKYQIDSYDKTKKLVEDQYGSLGLETWKTLMEEDVSDIEDCPGCGEISDEWIDKIKTKMDEFDVYIDESFDDEVNIITNLIKDFNYNMNDINKKIKEIIKEKLKTEDQTELEKAEIIVKKKVLFAGIESGWLIDHLF